MARERRPAQATHQLSLLSEPSELLQALAPLPPLGSCPRAAGRVRRLPRVVLTAAPLAPVNTLMGNKSAAPSARSVLGLPVREEIHWRGESS